MYKEYHVFGINASTIACMNTDYSGKVISPFGSWLRAELRRRGMTQNEFAKKIGVSNTSVSRWVNGDKPKGEHIDAMSDVLLLDYDLVATRAGYRPRELMLDVDPNSAEGQLVPLIRDIDWAYGDRLEKMKHELRFMIDWDRERREKNR